MVDKKSGHKFLCKGNREVGGEDPACNEDLLEESSRNGGWEASGLGATRASSVRRGSLAGVRPRLAQITHGATAAFPPKARAASVARGGGAANAVPDDGQPQRRRVRKDQRLSGLDVAPQVAPSTAQSPRLLKGLSFGGDTLGDPDCGGRLSASICMARADMRK